MIVHKLLRRGFEIAKDNAFIEDKYSARSEGRIDWSEAEWELYAEIAKYPTPSIVSHYECFAVIVAQGDQILGIGTFSESTPTLNLGERGPLKYTVPIICESSNVSYDDAKRRVEEQLEGDCFAWGGRLVRDPVRGTYRDNR